MRVTDENKNEVIRRQESQEYDTRMNSSFVKADTFKLNNSRIKQMPKYSMPKSVYHSYFGLKPHEKPTPGPGSHNNQHIRSISANDSGGVRISPSKSGGSRKKIEAAVVGPGAYYPSNLTSFPVVLRKNNQSKSR